MEISASSLGGLSLVRALTGPGDVARAKEIRARRDAIYGNVYREADTDLRWVGDLGEMAMAEWLESEKLPFEWLTDDEGAAGAHDFKVGGWRIGVKTVKRKVPVRPDYTAQITERHVAEPSDGYFFLTYHVPSGAMWMLGAIGKDRFLRDATRYGPGEWVHPKYRVRGDHAIRNIGISALTSPVAWLGMVRERVASGR